MEVFTKLKLLAIPRNTCDKIIIRVDCLSKSYKIYFPQINLLSYKHFQKCLEVCTAFNIFTFLQYGFSEKRKLNAIINILNFVY